MEWRVNFNQDSANRKKNRIIPHSLYIFCKFLIGLNNKLNKSLNTDQQQVDIEPDRLINQ